MILFLTSTVILPSLCHNLTPGLSFLLFCIIIFLSFNLWYSNRPSWQFSHQIVTTCGSPTARKRCKCIKTEFSNPWWFHYNGKRDLRVFVGAQRGCACDLQRGGVCAIRWLAFIPHEVTVGAKLFDQDTRRHQLSAGEFPLKSVCEICDTIKMYFSVRRSNDRCWFHTNRLKARACPLIRTNSSRRTFLSPLLPFSFC